eukprot:TRINITY_DN5263_c0_g1_i1.p1 TRINITY_DN5263_c0_g1~~TRINITY_DN5263_c0_g1_i1.p1  ORF type:complete len:912 (-),score=196.62 TRINITY_DN5263_c0_g1_i1:72-2807(-)
MPHRLFVIAVGYIFFNSAIVLLSFISNAYSQSGWFAEILCNHWIFLDYLLRCFVILLVIYHFWRWSLLAANKTMYRIRFYSWQAISFWLMIVVLLILLQVVWVYTADNTNGMLELQNEDFPNEHVFVCIRPLRSFYHDTNDSQAFFSFSLLTEMPGLIGILVLYGTIKKLLGCSLLFAVKRRLSILGYSCLAVLFIYLIHVIVDSVLFAYNNKYSFEVKFSGFDNHMIPQSFFILRVYTIWNYVFYYFIFISVFLGVWQDWLDFKFSHYPLKVLEWTLNMFGVKHRWSLYAPPVPTGDSLTKQRKHSLQKLKSLKSRLGNLLGLFLDTRDVKWLFSMEESNSPPEKSSCGTNEKSWNLQNFLQLMSNDDGSQTTIFTKFSNFDGNIDDEELLAGTKSVDESDIEKVQAAVTVATMSKRVQLRCSLKRNANLNKPSFLSLLKKMEPGSRTKLMELVNMDEKALLAYYHDILGTVEKDHLNLWSLVDFALIVEFFHTRALRNERRKQKKNLPHESCGFGVVFRLLSRSIGKFIRFLRCCKQRKQQKNTIVPSSLLAMPPRLTIPPKLGVAIPLNTNPNPPLRHTTSTSTTSNNNNNNNIIGNGNTGNFTATARSPNGIQHFNLMQQHLQQQRQQSQYQQQQQQHANSNRHHGSDHSGSDVESVFGGMSDNFPCFGSSSSSLPHSSESTSSRKIRSFDKSSIPLQIRYFLQKIKQENCGRFSKRVNRRQYPLNRSSYGQVSPSAALELDRFSSFISPASTPVAGSRQGSTMGKFSEDGHEEDDGEDDIDDSVIRTRSKIGTMTNLSTSFHTLETSTFISPLKISRNPTTVLDSMHSPLPEVRNNCAIIDNRTLPLSRILMKDSSSESGKLASILPSSETEESGFAPRNGVKDNKLILPSIIMGMKNQHQQQLQQ